MGEVHLRPHGTGVVVPHGVPHAMWNPGDEPNRLIEILTPGDGDLFFRDAAALPDDASAEELEAMAARHGITYFDDWTTDLRSRYGLA